MAGNQYLSPLGNMGFGSSGLYSSYDPMMMAYGSMMDPSMTMLGGGVGMMYNPMMYMTNGGAAADSSGKTTWDRYIESIEKLNEFTEKNEERRLQHATEMHRKSQLAEVANLSSHDQAFFLKAVEDGDVQHCVREMHDAIRKGNLAYATKVFFEMKQVLYNKNSEYFNSSDGNVNTDEKVKQCICILYSEIAGAYASSGGMKPDLKEDILHYGPTSAEKGFYQAYFGNKNENKLTGEEALNQMFGTGIEDANFKAKVEKAFGWVGRGAQVATAGLIGGAVGMAGLGTLKFFTPGWLTRNCPTNRVTRWATRFKTAGKAGALLAMGADILWQLSK